MQKRISIITLISITSIKSQFLKPTVKLILTWKIEAFLSIQNGGSFIFRKICKKYLLLGRYVLTLLGLHDVFAFINIRNLRQRQRSSDKFRLHKRFLYNIQYFNISSHFQYFHCSNFKMTFDKNIYEKRQQFLNLFQISAMSQNIMFC